VRAFQRISEKGPKSVGDYGAWNDCLQYTSVAEVVGREESSPHQSVEQPDPPVGQIVRCEIWEMKLDPKQ